MIEVTVEQFEKNFDEYMDAIENEGAEFLIRKSDGSAVVAVPAGELEQIADEVGEEDWYNIFSDHHDAS